MEYDVAERRDTPLALKLKQRIGRQGPVSVADYIRACLSDPEHGYYVRHPAIGRAGDFITAPEISQVFGELVGLWCAVVWQQMGSPRRFNLVELGPGRGTLISDALRAARIVPGFLDAADVLLVESNAALKQMQQDALAGSGARLGWGEMRNLAPAPTVLIANEFLDVLPISQVMLTKEGWVERAVGIDGAGRLQYVAGRRVDAKEPERLITAGPGEIFETRELDGIIGRLGELSLQASMAVLFVDYGHARSLAGDSLQAVRNHRFEHPLASPGEADLTSQVDFEALREAAAAAGLSADGPVTQSEFLGRLGIMERASRLMAANPEDAGQIEAGVARLMSPAGMGSRFKAVGLRRRPLATLPGLETVRTG